MDKPRVIRHGTFMTRSLPNPSLAIAFMLCATAFIAGTMIAAKVLGSDLLGPALHPLQVSHGRFLFALIAIAISFAVFRPPVSAPQWRVHAGRSLFGWLGVTCMFGAVAVIPLSDASAISFLNPVMCMLLAIPLLGERVGKWRWLAAIMALTGALILLRPGTTAFQPAALLALAAAVLLGMELIFIKKLANKEGPFQILLINNGIGWALASTAVIPVFMAPTLQQWVVLAALGVIMAAAQACFVNAMARADASFITPFSYITLVFAALFDAAIFGVLPDAISWLGAVIILAGAFLLATRERVATSKKRTSAA